MLSIKTLLALSVSLSLAIGSAIPVDQSLANPLQKRADLRCPGSDNDIYTGPRGGQWRIRCMRGCPNQATLSNGIINNISFENCINSCDARPNDCNVVNFSGDVSSGTCYLKGSCGGSLVVKDGTKTATKLN